MSPEQISICTGSSKASAEKYAAAITAAMDEFHIDSPARQAAFLAQIGHESYGFQWMHELWGPTAQQLKYEPSSSVAARLGNVSPGDGRRYAGRGPIQITGRANYCLIGGRLKLDLEQHPELLDDPLNAFRSAGAFWEMHKLNELADMGDFETITRRINGGLTGVEDRQRRWESAKRALGVKVANS